MAAAAPWLTDNGLVWILAADTCFFLLCWACYQCQRRWRRRGTDSTGNRARLLGGEEPAEVPKPRLSATASNYIAFLDTGFKLFALLAVAAVVSTLAVWDVDILVRGESMRSIRRTLFLGPEACRAGFPGVLSSAVRSCVPANSSRSGWHPRLAGDPRPEGHYVTSATLEDCEHEALLCGAAALAFGRELGGPGASECWLFNTGVANASLLRDEGFTYCEGHQDLVPGIVQFSLTLAYGVATIGFAFRLLGRLSSSEKSLLEGCGLWLTGLPCADREDGVPFDLTEADFERVAKDLKQAITDKLQKLLRDEGVGGPYEQEEKVLSVGVLHRNWGHTSGQGDDARQRLAGHAFAIMSREAYAAALLTTREPLCGLTCLRCLPSYVRWRKYTLFKFGVPPWSAVTLHCRKPPPPSDIIWKNLHYHWHGTLLRRLGLQLLLFLFSVSLVAPVSLASNVYMVILALHDFNMRSSPVQLPPEFWQLLGQVVDNLPSYFLLLVNSVVLPLLIQLVFDFSRPHLRSKSEAHQFSSNLFYLLVNSFLVPLLGFLTTKQPLWEQFFHYFSQLQTEHTGDALSAVGALSRQAPSLLMLKYTANAALVTSACQLIQVGKGVGRRCLCMPDEPWPFAWGYWYAWSMCVMIVSLVMGVVMPTQVLLAVLFFGLMRWVHKANLERGVFDITFDMDREAEILIVCWMLKAVSLFWLFMAAFFYSQPLDDIGPGGSVTIWAPHNRHEIVVQRVLNTPLVLPVKLVRFCYILIPAAGCCMAARLFSEQGPFERQLWRRVGRAGVEAVICCLRATAVLLAVVGIVTCRPHVAWWKVEVPKQVVAAGILAVLALLTYQAAFLLQWLGNRKSNAIRDITDLKGALRASKRVDTKLLLQEAGMEAFKDLLESKRIGRLSSVREGLSEDAEEV